MAERHRRPLATADGSRGASLSIIPETWAEAQTWLTFPEWQWLIERQRNRQAEDPEEPCDFEEWRVQLASSGLKSPVQKTLLHMAEYADRYGWTCISKIRIARETGISERTVNRHWNAARAAGFLRSHDYPAILRRTSDHWLILPDESALPAVGWERYETPFIGSPGEPPF